MNVQKNNNILNYPGDQEPIAITGMGCRFPGGANSPEELWKLLKEGKDLVTEIPENRWSKKSFYSKNRSQKGKTVSIWGGFVDNIDMFDAGFFGISPREANYLDPQQRLLLETSWEALEDSGLVVEKLAGTSVGVFIGAFTLDYKIMQFGGSDYDTIGTHTAVGSMMTLVANRISYAYDLRGPSMAIDTACSSSLVAMHTACRSIRNKECTMALAGGVLLNFAPQYTIAESQGGFLSEDGRSKAFDSRANGYVRGEGVGVVVLKPLSKAIEDNDEIYAVILGSAVNQDGSTSSITVPRGEAQQDVMRYACADAGVNPAQVQYVEAHGTGTPIGDPIEASALGSVYGVGREKSNPCIVGSVKTNIGHTEAAAGVAGLIKTSMCIKNKEIPKHLHFIQANPKIDFESLGIRLPLKLEQWPEHEGIAMAGVNSFGFGGTNSHAILAEAPKPLIEEKTWNMDGKPVVLPLSARSAKALQELADSNSGILGSEDFHGKLYDVAYTLAFRRDHHDKRLAVVAADIKELSEKLSVFAAGEECEGLIHGQKLSNIKNGIVFVFTGMGPQWWAMGRQLIETEPIFREMIEQCDAEFKKHSGWSLMAEMTASEETSQMNSTRVSQPSNFAIQVALAALWRSWGIKPEVIIGHSTGEVAACYEAGVYSFEDAVRIIYYRSMLQQRLAGMGKMLAVGLDEANARELLASYDGKVDVAAVNSFNGVTLAGNAEALDEIAADLTNKSIFNKFLQVEIPFHSPCMELIKDDLLEGLKNIKPRTPEITLYSTALGKKVDGSEMDAGYWWKNVRQAVLFAPACNEIIKEGYGMFLEVGPHPVLASSISELLKHNGVEGIATPSLKRKENERRTMLASLSRFYTAGYDVDFTAFYPHKGSFIRLSKYKWQRERYWNETVSAEKRRLGQFDHPLLGRRVESPEPQWEGELKKEVLPYITDHCIQGNVVCPAAGYIEMAFEAASVALGKGHYTLKDVEFAKALFVNDEKATKTYIVLNRDNSSFKVYSMTPNGADAASFGRFTQSQNNGRLKHTDVDYLLSQAKSKGYKEFSSNVCYEKFHELGFQYGPAFQGIDKIWVGENETIAKLTIPDAISGMTDEYHIHPSILDSCFQCIIALNFVDTGKPEGSSEVRLPVKALEISVYGSVEPEMLVRSVMKYEDEKMSVGDIFLYGKNGEIIAEILGFTVQAMDSVRGDINVKTIDSWIYDLNWVEKNNEEKDKNEAVSENSWILLADKKGVAKELAKALSEKGGECILVYPSDSFSIDVDAGEARIAPDSLEDFKKLFLELPFKKPLKSIIHMWNLDVESVENLDTQKIEDAKIKGAFSVISMLQGIVHSGKTPSVWLVTSGAQLIGDEQGTVEVGQASVWGMARVIGNQEHTGLWGGIADIDPENAVDSVKSLAEDIIAFDGEDQVSYRKGTRYVARVYNIPGMNEPLKPEFKANASYMVTGAFGSLGKLTVSWMAKSGARNIILLGRTNIPPRSEWNTVSLDSDVGSRIEFIKEIEAFGVNVHIASVDMSDEAQLKKYIEEYYIKGLPEIRGIISAAGMVFDRLIT